MAECKVFSCHADLRDRMREGRDADAAREKNETDGEQEEEEEKDGGGDVESFVPWHAVAFAAVGVLRFVDKREQLMREENGQEMDETSGCWDTLGEVKFAFRICLCCMDDGHCHPHSIL